MPKDAKRKLPIPSAVKSLRLPHIKFNSSLYVPLLIVLLIVASFLLGVLVTKVDYLEKGLGTTAAAVPSGTTGNTAPGGPATPAPAVNVSVGHLPIMGDPNAKVTVVEFADFRCPFCEQLFRQVEPNLIKDYVNTGKVKFYFRHYAFLGDASTLAANASECANEQGAFWKMHDYFYQNQPAESDTSMYTIANLTQVAGTLGMNTSQFESCLSTNKYQKNVDQDMTEGQAAGVNGTPATFIDGQQVSGAEDYSVFKNLIDQELAK